MSDVYQSIQNVEKSQIIYTNVADIKLIPETSEAKIGDIKVKLRSQTMNVARQFQTKNASTIRTLHSILLNMFLLEFVTIIKEKSDFGKTRISDRGKSVELYNSVYI